MGTYSNCIDTNSINLYDTKTHRICDTSYTVVRIERCAYAQMYVHIHLGGSQVDRLIFDRHLYKQKISSIFFDRAEIECSE